MPVSNPNSRGAKSLLFEDEHQLNKGLSVAQKRRRQKEQKLLDDLNKNGLGLFFEEENLGLRPASEWGRVSSKASSKTISEVSFAQKEAMSREPSKESSHLRLLENPRLVEKATEVSDALIFEATKRVLDDVRTRKVSSPNTNENLTVEHSALEISAAEISAAEISAVENSAVEISAAETSEREKADSKASQQGLAPFMHISGFILFGLPLLFMTLNVVSDNIDRFKVSGVGFPTLSAVSLELTIIAFSIFSPRLVARFKTSRDWVDSITASGKFILCKSILLGLLGFSLWNMTVSTRLDGAAELEKISAASYDHSIDNEIKEYIASMKDYREKGESGNLSKTKRRLKELRSIKASMISSESVAGLKKAKVLETENKVAQKVFSLLLTVICAHGLALSFRGKLAFV